MVHYEESQQFRQPVLIALLALGFIAVTALGWWDVATSGPLQDRSWAIALSLVWTVLTVSFIAWFLLMRLQVSVVDDAVEVKFHFMWPRRRYPVDDIEAVEVCTYRPIRDYGGWGVKWGRRGRVFNVSGNQGVELTLRNGKRVMLGSQDPEPLAQAIEARRSGVRAGR